MNLNCLRTINTVQNLVLRSRFYSSIVYNSPKLKQYRSTFNIDKLTLNYSIKSKKMEVFDENKIDPIQKNLLNEECILVDDTDSIIGHASKKDCHLIGKDGDIKLHRAFSVFLFNTKGELLLQQRSKVKVTFPLMYTNTCCSHPLFREEEMSEDEQCLSNIKHTGLGVKVAAQRRLFEELGIVPEDVPLEEFHYLTRIHYKAPSNGIWGEHEIDYILIIQKDVTINPNPNEISDVRYVKLEELQKLIQQENIEFTPWFKICFQSGKLANWWNNLDNLKQFEDHQNIFKL